MKKLLSALLVCLLAFCLCACAGQEEKPENIDDEKTVYEIGICNFVDDASLNQIYENIVTRLQELGDTYNVKFVISYDNPNADANVMTQITTNFVVDKVDLMVGIATPVAMNMQAATEDNQIPVIFAAVSDPLGAGLVESMGAPGANISGTSDYLDTAAMMDLITALNPDIKKVGLLYDVSQDSSTAAIASVKLLLKEKGIEVVEKTGTNVDEIKLAVQSLISEKVEAVFTPSDNTVMTAELSIYEDLLAAGIPHFAGADSFALNGAFLGYGVDYSNLGKQTADMIYEVLVEGKDPATLPVRTFDNGIATINNEAIKALGLDLSDLQAKFEPYCTKIQTIDTAESFN
ncbi:MAG: ABC transporter substrate-binding protein [Erysipelotrichaceae bacterium]|nr:ABC transporter substrate-binding protein [Erysipelotrichaceae bacterium]